MKDIKDTKNLIKGLNEKQGVVFEILSKDELKRIQEERHIMELPLKMHIPLTIQVDSELGIELNLKQPIPPGYYQLRIEVISDNKLVVYYYQKILEYTITIFTQEILYVEGENYSQVIKNSVDLIYSYLERCSADLTTSVNFLVWLFGNKKEELKQKTLLTEENYLSSVNNVDIIL